MALSGTPPCHETAASEGQTRCDPAKPWHTRSPSLLWITCCDVHLVVNGKRMRHFFLVEELRVFSEHVFAKKNTLLWNLCQFYHFLTYCVHGSSFYSTLGSQLFSGSIAKSSFLTSFCMGKLSFCNGSTGFFGDPQSVIAPGKEMLVCVFSTPAKSWFWARESVCIRLLGFQGCRGGMNRPATRTPPV